MKPEKTKHKNKFRVCNHSLRVAKLRNRYGWSQELLASKAGISRKTLSRLETGDLGVTYRTMKAVFKALGVEVCEQCSACGDEE